LATRAAFSVDSTFTVNEILSAATERARLNVAHSGADFTPVGFYVPVGASVTLNVTKLSGTRYPKLLVGTYSRYLSAYAPLQVQLTEGQNVVTNTTTMPALLYLRYIADANPNGSTKVKFVSGMQSAPFFVKGQTTHDQWLTMLATFNTAPDVQLLSDRAIVVTSLAKAIAYQNEDQQTLLTTIDNTFGYEEQIMGLDNATALDAPRTNRLVLTQHDDPAQYMYATSYRAAFKESNINEILTVDGFKTSWGAWHEIGHTYQQNWKWTALGEVTNNIYSLKVQRTYGIASRLKTSNIWSKAVTFLAQPDATRDFNVSTSDVFVRLCMFQQLYLAFGDAFYIGQHKAYRFEKPTLADDTAKMRWFMLNACKTSGKDLGGFFKKWGLKVPQTVYDEITALNLPAPATDLTLLQD
jgi:hypothetical protein